MELKKESLAMFRKGILQRELTVVLIIIAVFSCVPSALAVDKDFEMYSSETNPIVKMNFDAAGYSDWWYWGYHWPRHPYSQHEMLSGE